ncbi:MAG: 2-oxo acid dehydrogenase subunit E2 [Acidobacteriia bacterium]|nr:2-oxo acid dehydrogenase subunit E2 [Terriglobia bacterium]
MATNVIMPQMGESIFEGTVTRWLKKVGDPVKRDEPLFEISTDKVDSEIPSPSSGVLTNILVPEGQTVQVNTVVAVLDGEGTAAATLAAPESVTTPVPLAKPAAAPPPPAQPVPGAEPAALGAPPEDIRSSPLVRRMAREYKIDLGRIKGTGLGNRITKQDIENYLSSAGVKVLPAAALQPPAPLTPAVKPAAAPPSPARPSTAPQTLVTPPPAPVAPTLPGGRVTIEPMSPMRRQISEHMVMSKRTSAHVNTVFEVDVTPIVKLREKEQENFLRTNGVKLTFTAFLVKAVADTLREFPILNSSVEGNNIVYKKDINVGVVQSGTFTITNPGIFGSLFGTPIINQPQVAILGVGSITKRPVVIEDDAIAIRSMIILSLSFDHRVVDGAVADQFMAALKKRLENWKSL